MVAKIATGELKDTVPSERRQAGQKSGMERAKKLTPAQRSEMARLAALARWKKSR
jgi:hypothetical protein